MARSKKQEALRFLMVFLITIGILVALRHLFNLYIPPYDNDKPKEEKADSQKILMAKAPVSQTDIAYEEQQAPAPNAVKQKKSKKQDIEKDTTESADEEKDSLILALEDSLRQDSINRRNTALFRQSGKIWDYDECLPDTQDQHIISAMEHGIQPVATHRAVLWKARRHQLVSISGSPFFVVEKMNYSMPYLVPKAKDLLTTISLNFLDSLRSKGMKLYLPIVTSALRSTLDVKKLTRNNRNATENSCHSYGTTFDITYSRYMPLTGIPTPVDSAEWKRSELKLTLAEVLFDLRNEGKCFVKHEHRQPCFHITVR